MHHQQIRNGGKQQNRRKIFNRVERQFGIQHRVHRVCKRGFEQRVTIGRRFGCQLGGNVAACAGADIDDNLLAPFLGELLRNGARSHITRPACGKTHQQAYGLAGVVSNGGLRACVGRNAGQCLRTQQRAEQGRFHRGHFRNKGEKIVRAI